MKKNIMKTFRIFGLAMFLAAGIIGLGQGISMAAANPTSIEHCGGHGPYGPRGGCGW